MNQDYTSIFTEIAAHLGGVYIPARWRGDETPETDRGYLVFGDPSDWRSLRLFIRWTRKGREDKFEISQMSRLYYTVDGITRELPDYSLPRRHDDINTSAGRPADAIAKSIKRRLLDPARETHAESVRTVEAEMAHDQDKKAWWDRVGVGGRGRGTVWYRDAKNYSGPRIEVDAQYSDIKVHLDCLTREQAERVIEFAKEALK